VENSAGRGSQSGSERRWRVCSAPLHGEAGGPGGSRGGECGAAAAMGKPSLGESGEEKERMDGRQPTGLGLGVQAKEALEHLQQQRYICAL
jgi:hypothetical protein